MDRSKGKKVALYKVLNWITSVVLSRMGWAPEIQVLQKLYAVELGFSPFFPLFLIFIEVACLVLALACFEIFLPTHQLLPIGIFNYYSKNSCFNWKSKFKFCTALIYVKNQPKSYFRQFCWVVFNFQTQFVV